MRGGTLCGAIALVALCAPGSAQAHMVATGFGAIYDGVAHFALSPEDSLPVLALALFAGLRGPACARLVLAALPLAWFVGGLATTTLAICLEPVALSATTASILVVVGALLAGNLRLTPPLVAAAALVLGLVRGAADAVGEAADLGGGLTLLGSSVAVFVAFALAASISLPLQRFWMVIATRVAGSWLAAVGLLLLGWLIRYGERAS